jgi:MinD superfamily P-loop ATPase
VYFCPEKAINFPVNTCGQWFISDTRFGPMVHARLGIAEENSGKLVTLVRQESRKLAEEKGLDLIITDGPPGIGCPVIASIGGASAVLIVTEPTVSGKHDLKVRLSF